MSVLSKSATSRGARSLLLASATALVMSSFGAQAAPAVARQTADAPQVSAANDSDFSARKRYRRGGNAAGLAMMGMMVGVIGTAIINQQRRDAYERAYRPAYVQHPGYAQYPAYAQHPGYVQHPAYVQPQPHYVRPRGYMHYPGGEVPAQAGYLNRPYTPGGRYDP